MIIKQAGKLLAAIESLRCVSFLCSENYQEYNTIRYNTEQGWQVSANSGLNRGLYRFKPSWQKQVFAGFYQTWYNNCSIKGTLS